MTYPTVAIHKDLDYTSKDCDIVVVAVSGSRLPTSKIKFGK